MNVRAIRGMLMIVLGFLFLVLPVTAQDQVPPPPAAGKAKPAAAPCTPAVEPAKVPDVVLTRAETVATVTKNIVECQMTLALTSRSDEMQPVLVLPASIAVTGVEVRKGNRDGVQLVRRAQGYQLYSLRKGDYELVINFAVSAAGEDLKRQMVLPMPQATTAVLAVVLPGASLDVSLSPDVPFKADDSKGGTTTVTVFGGPAESLTVTWSPKAPEKNLEARVFAENNSVVRFGQGVLRNESRINYSIIQGKVSTFRVRLPEQGTLLKVEGENIRDWEIETADKSRVLRVDLLGPIAEKYVFTLAMEQPIETPVTGKPLALELPLPEAVAASRETGSVAVVADKGLKAEAGTLTGVSQIDVRDMPLVAAPGTNEETHLGFKYVKRPVRIAVRLGVVEPQVSGEVFSLVRIAPESIRMTSVIKYQIRDSGVFSFRVRLDKDVRLVAPQGSDINNWSLTDQVLTVDLRSKAENEYALTLITEKQIQGTDVQVPRLELLDVQRERGFVALEPAPGARIDPKTAEGITQINVKDLPADVKELQTAALAYRYIRHPYQLGVTISEVQPEIVAATQTLVDIDETDLKVAFDVTYDIRKSGVFSLRLAAPPGLQILTLTGAQVEDWKQAKDTGLVEVTLKSRTDGTCALHLTGEKRLAREADKPVALPRFVLEGVRRDTGFLAVRPADGLRVRSDEKALINFSEIDVKELAPALQQCGVTLAYKYYLPTWQAALQVEKIEPYVTAEVFNFISLGEAYIQASAAIKYSIQYAGVQTFRFKLPADAVNIDITAPNIKSKEQQVDPKDKGLIWTVTFQAKCKDALKIVMSYQTKVEKDVKELDYVGVQALDVSQEHGFLAVAPRSDLEVSATDKTVGMIAIDDHEIPAEYMRGIPAVALAYRYPKPPYNLHLSMIHRQPADVLVAVIDSCRLTTLVTDDGNLMTDAVYLMRNVRKQYLELRLPAGAQIWHAYVGPDQVTPVTSDLHGETVTMIPITGRGKGQQQFEIRLRYSSRSHSLGEIGRLALKVPGTEVAAIRVGWEIDIPLDYVVLTSGGTMNRVESLDAALTAISMVPPDPARIYSEAAANKAADQATMQEEMNRRVNDYNATVTVQALAPAPKAAVYAQDKSPVKRVYFQSLVAMGDPPTLRLSYLRAPWEAVTRGLLVIIIALCGFGFWIRSCASVTWKFAGLVSAVALLLALRTIAGYSFGVFLTDMLETLAAVVVLMAVAQVVAAIYHMFITRRDRSRRAAADDIPLVPPVLHPAPAGHSPGQGTSTPQGGSSASSTED